jgi:hypothetical protein
MDLYMKRKLKGIPRENVAMTGSACDLTFIDLSQLWDDPSVKDITALAVGASDYWALPSERTSRGRSQHDPGARALRH